MTPIEPSRESATVNAFHIISNAIHSAGNGASSLNHNGWLWLLSAVIPKGTLLYRQDRPPPGPEWLALEVKHAEMFPCHGSNSLGDSRLQRQQWCQRRGPGAAQAQHASRANRDLNLLYADG